MQRHVDNAVGAEMAEILAQFAPGHEDTHMLEITERKGQTRRREIRPCSSP